MLFVVVMIAHVRIIPRILWLPPSVQMSLVGALGVIRLEEGTSASHQQSFPCPCHHLRMWLSLLVPRRRDAVLHLLLLRHWSFLWWRLIFRPWSHPLLPLWEGRGRRSHKASDQFVLRVFLGVVPRLWRTNIAEGSADGLSLLEYKVYMLRSGQWTLFGSGQHSVLFFLA